MTTIPMCKAVCGDCKRAFPYPSLGDQSYGLFILHREDGRAFRYLQSIDNEVWNFVAARVQPRDPEPVRSTGAVLQEVVARLADPSEGRSFTMEMVCPYCRSRHFRGWEGEQVSTEEIPDATFQSFTALDDGAKDRLVRKLEMRVRADCGTGDNKAT
jgi:hypothetical protein